MYLVSTWLPSFAFFFKNLLLLLLLFFFWGGGDNYDDDDAVDKCVWGTILEHAYLAWVEQAK